jgi:hypothetical protein
MDLEDAKKMQWLLAQLKARKEVLITEKENQKNPAPIVYNSKLEQVTREHVDEALRDWKVL